MALRITGWKEDICDDGKECNAGEVEVRDLARGLSGALFVSLPLLFTMEMWQIARTIPDWTSLCFAAVTFVLVRYYIGFAGFRKDDGFEHSPWWDTVVAFGIGAFASVITLFVAGIIMPELSTKLILKTVALETLPTSVGAAVAINQLGSGDKGATDKTGLSPDGVVLVGTVLGAFLFAFNIAPTIETKVITLQQNWWLIAATFVLSLAVTYMVVAVACFEQRDLSERKYITSEWLETLVSYLAAFAISVLLLWVFGYSTPFDPMEVWFPQAVVLGYATTLGGAAGRLVL
ncbi:DUF2391 family protein [Erythrobacter alti]|uniref:DUF2391 family protein n=1 Tax=Erythrobacter alti TaxID=1896145 RepID=UPI0030F3CDDE